MTQKEMVLDAIRELPDNASVREIADRLEFLAAIQGGWDQLDRGESIPHEGQTAVGFMAYRLIWSPLARDDLRNLVRFIARDNPGRASSFGLELIQRTEMVQEMPEMGRVVPERRDPRLREVVLRPYAWLI